MKKMTSTSVRSNLSQFKTGRSHPRATRTRWLERGFTLMEVMVALMVFALVSTAVSRVTSQGAQQALYLQRKTIATWIVENKLTEMRVLSFGTPVTKGRGNETVEMANETWVVSWVVEPLRGNANFLKADVSVAPESNKDSPIVTMTSSFGAR